MRHTERGDGVPTHEFLRDCVHIRKRLAVRYEREAVPPKHGVQLRLGFLLYLGMICQDKEETSNRRVCCLGAACTNS